VGLSSLAILPQTGTLTFVRAQVQERGWPDSASPNRLNRLDNTITVRTRAQSLYKSLFGSSDLFTQVRNELGLLVSVLNVTEEYTPRFQPDDPKLSELNDARDKCHHALYELSQFKDHFDNVGPQAQVAWERSDWGGTELLDIRSKLTLYIQMLNALNSSISRYDLQLQSQCAQIFTGTLPVRPLKTLKEC
jgi:hypothetical protein